MKKNDVINRLAWIIINAASPDGYISSNDLDFANDCLDKVQRQSNTGLQADGLCLYPGCDDIGWNGGYCRLHNPANTLAPLSAWKTN